MSWITPITNWIASNVLTPTDMNRIEGNTQHLKDNKVDKVAGKSLSTEDYTTAEKTKLSGIEAGATADQTGAEIKSLYEGNSNTNAYTDAEKTKLGGIETGAQVNTVTSVAGKTGAVSLTKADVGLNAVLNYGLATQAEAQAGTSNTKYMTPLRVKEAVGSWDFSKIVQVSSSSQTAKTLVNVSGSGVCAGGTISTRSSGCNVTMVVDGVSKTLPETRFYQTNSGEDRTHVPVVRYKSSLVISHAANTEREVTAVLAYIPD